MEIIQKKIKKALIKKCREMLENRFSAKAAVLSINSINFNNVFMCHPNTIRPFRAVTCGYPVAHVVFRGIRNSRARIGGEIKALIKPEDEGGIMIESAWVDRQKRRK